MIMCSTSSMLRFWLLAGIASARPIDSGSEASAPEPIALRNPRRPSLVIFPSLLFGETDKSAGHQILDSLADGRYSVPSRLSRTGEFFPVPFRPCSDKWRTSTTRSEEHTSELQSLR